MPGVAGQGRHDSPPAGTPSETAGTNLRAAETARLRSAGGPDRLARSAADRRAPRRLAAARRRASRSSVQPRAYDFAHRVSEYSGLQTPSELPPIEAVDRSAWIAANLLTMRPLLGSLGERLGEGGRTAGRTAALCFGLPARRAGGRADRRALTARARAVRPGAARRDGHAATAAARAEPRDRGAQPVGRPRRAACCGSRSTRSRTPCSSPARHGCARTSAGCCRS